MRDRTTVVREHDTLKDCANLSIQDLNELETVARDVLKHKDGDLAASNYVGVVTTSSGSILEILPKIDLTTEDDANHTKTRELFLQMLLCSRLAPKDLPESRIRELRNFRMLDLFIHQLLVSLRMIAHGGLARKYVTMTGNLPHIRGRVLFAQHLRENLINQSRIYSEYDELSVNRPVNRLIATTLALLQSYVAYDRDQRLLRELQVLYADVPHSSNIIADWRSHHVDRTMRHYAAAMEWIGLFLFNYGLATYAGKHSNVSLLFPMEQIFEDFVTKCFGRYQRRYLVRPQGPMENLLSKGNQEIFQLKPDISLMDGDNVRFILDAKWKAVDSWAEDHKHGISQADLYQLYAYSKRYECHGVALVYPKSLTFSAPIQFKYFDDMPLICFPFDVENPKTSVRQLSQLLQTQTSVETTS